MYFLKIGINQDSKKIEPEIVEYNHTEDKLDFFYNRLSCQCIDVVDVGEEICLVCDDEGLLNTGNPVMEIHHDDFVENIKLAGHILMGKNAVTKEGIEIVGFNTEGELLKATREFRFGVYGVVK